MVKSDILYQIDTRLQKIKGSDAPFGGVAVFLFGDMLQLKPVAGKYIFKEPTASGDAISYAIRPLWDFLVLKKLTINHRQGEDWEYSEMLNRFRVAEKGSQIEDTDLALLKTRVVRKNDPSLPDDYLFLAATNEECNGVNLEKLIKLDGEEITIKAAILSKSKKEPNIKNSGEIYGTPLQFILKLKKFCRLICTFNLDVLDR